MNTDIDSITDAILDTLTKINAHPATANEALIRIAAISAGSNGVDNRETAAKLFNAVWEFAYSDTH
jgi:hypothetical protein